MRSTTALVSGAAIARKGSALVPRQQSSTLPAMLRPTGAVLGLLAALASAPFQCTSKPDPNQAIEETPADALYSLAQEFKKAGDNAGWRRTLTYLVRNYPSSRYAVAAKQDLTDASGQPQK